MGGFTRVRPPSRIPSFKGFPKIRVLGDRSQKGSGNLVIPSFEGFT